MAITGTLTADFASFFDACSKAEVSLKGFEASTGKVSTSLDRMVDNFSGRKIITEATLMAEAVERIGGTSKLTQAELAKIGNVAAEASAKFKAWGQEVPQNIQALATHAKSASSAFAGMLPILSTLAGAFGVTFSIGAVVNFTKELFNAADLLTKLHDKTGISIEGLQRFQIAGDDAGNTIDELTAAIVKMEDKLAGGDKSAAGALAKLGLSFADLKGLSPENQFIKISDAIREIKDPAERVNIAIDLFGKAGANVLPTLIRGFDDLKGAAVGMSAETVKALADAGDAFGRYWRAVKGIGGEALAVMIKGITDPGQYGEMARALDGATAAATKAAPSFGALAVPGLPKDLKDIEAALDKGREAMVTANAAAKTLAETEKFLLGITLEGEIALNKAWVDRLEQTLTGAGQIHRAEADLADFIAKTSLDSLNYQILKIWERVDEEEKAFKGSEAQRASYNAAVEALATEEAQALRNTADATAAALAAATEAGAARQIAAIKQVTGSYWEQIDAAARAAGVTVVGFRPGEGPGINGAPPTSGFSLGPFNLNPFSLSGHAAGGPVSAGPAMLHDNEYVVPEHGALVMRGGGGVSISITVNGSMLGSKEELATVIRSALDNRMSALGIRFPSGA